MPETWEFLASTPLSPPPPAPKKKTLHGKVACPRGKWTMDSSPHQTQREKQYLSSLTYKRKREVPSLHGETSHWLHGNYIPKIGCHYFWPGLIALPKNRVRTLPIVLVDVICGMKRLLRRGNGKPLNNLPPKSAFFPLVIYSQKEELTSCCLPHT